jgi:hypothetical protein
MKENRYDPQVVGDFWANLPLDHYFDNATDTWASMRSSWTDSTSLFAAMKAGIATGHQTHNDIDAGDFVIEALGQRWAGELVCTVTIHRRLFLTDAWQCQNDYLGAGYFSSDAQNSQRWLYYRFVSSH